jgi:hypothetical protein
MGANTVTKYTSYTRRGSSTAKRGLRGAAGGVYVGPARPTSGDDQAATHATGGTTGSGGGIEDSSGYRSKDAFSANGATGGFAGAPAEGQFLTRSNTRPTGRTQYTADGVGGSDVTGSLASVPGIPVQRYGQGHTTARAYVTDGAVTGATGAVIDKRSTQADARALGSAGRGLRYLESVTGSPTTISASYPKTLYQKPSTHASAESSGTVALVNGSGVISVAVHDDDLTAGALSREGCEVAVFAHLTDADEDGDLQGLYKVTGIAGANDDTSLGDTFAAADYNVYARWRYAVDDGTFAVGPWSDRRVVTVS